MVTLRCKNSTKKFWRLRINEIYAFYCKRESLFFANNWNGEQIYDN